MDFPPTLWQLLEALPTGRAVYTVLRDVPEAELDGEYVHYEAIASESESERRWRWAGIKLRRAGGRVDLVGSRSMSFCQPRRLQDLLLAVLAPLPDGLPPVPAVAMMFDRAEAEIADAIGACQLDGVEVEPATGAGLLRIRRSARTDAERGLVAARQGLSLTRGGPALLPELRRFHPLLGVSLGAVARMRAEPGGAMGAILADWRRGLRGTGIPGVDGLAPLAGLARPALDRALDGMATDEEDATYPVLVLLAALRDARERWLSAHAARARRLAELGTDPTINDRQALVLDAMSATPGYATALAHHQATFGVVYETARTDLQDLARQGRLTMTRQGRAFIFTAGSTAPASGPPARPPAEPTPQSLSGPEDSLPVFF